MAINLLQVIIYPFVIAVEAWLLTDVLMDTVILTASAASAIRGKLNSFQGHKAQ